MPCTPPEAEFGTPPPNTLPRWDASGKSTSHLERLDHSVQASLHWVAAADAVAAEIRLYSHLSNRPDPGADRDALADLNPDSLEVLTGALVEPALADGLVGEAVQFERTGYFALDPESRPGRPVFNRTVGLRDSWAKVQTKA